jgi:hypothetical protein
VDKNHDPRESQRDLIGGLVGAAVVLTCLGPFMLLASARPTLTLCGPLILLGCVAGSLGCKTVKPLRALLMGVLPFMAVSLLYLPFLAGYLWVTEWWGYDPSMETATLDALALLASASSLGGLCGFVASIGSRIVPRLTVEKRRLQFTIQEVLWLFLLVALYLGPILYFLRDRLPK